MKTIIIVSMTIFSWAGSYVPALWGGDLLSPSSILFGALGGFFGIWIGYHTAHRLGLD